MHSEKEEIRFKSKFLQLIYTLYININLLFITYFYFILKNQNFYFSEIIFSRIFLLFSFIFYNFLI
jgi:hypothetical protein